MGFKKTSGEAPPTSSTNSKYDFADMAINDCLEFDDEDEFLRARKAVQMYKHRNPGFNYTSRKADGGGKIWRTA